MRLIEMNRASTEMVVPRPTTASAAQPPTLCGPCQFSVTSAARPSTAVEPSRVYQVVSCGSASCSVARVISRIAVRQSAEPNAKATPASAMSSGLARIINARPAKATSAASAPRQVIRSRPNSTPSSPVISG